MRKKCICVKIKINNKKIMYIYLGSFPVNLTGRENVNVWKIEKICLESASEHRGARLRPPTPPCITVCIPNMYTCMYTCMYT